MNQFDENELRKKIRSDLQKQHQEKQNNKNKEESSSTQDAVKLSDSLKRRIRQYEEDRLFAKHPQFIKCENHLSETTWLTALEKAEQHEFFPIEETFWDKLKSKFAFPKKYFPETTEVEEFRQQTIVTIKKNIEERLKKYHELIEQHEHKKQKNRIDEIIEQEEEAFFKSHPDYKLYRNYLGNTRWLTKEELEKEEEFTERVRTSKEKFMLYSGWTILLLVVLAMFYFIKVNFVDTQENGFLIISSNESKGQLYIDEKLHLGFKINQAIPLKLGSHSITYRKEGFKSTPNVLNVDISLNDTTYLEFNLSAITADNQGFVKIKATYDDAKLFINDEFSGFVENNQNLLLDSGDHAIELKKENYLVFPSQKTITVKPGDSVEVSFTFEARTNGRKTSSLIKTGLLEINSNVKGAKIFLNRKDTGHKTNYVFNNLPFSSYLISVEKEGYKSFPEEKEIKLTSQKNHSKISFHLTRTTMPVTIVTRPVAGKIYINERDAGIGKWSGSLPVGDHQIRFGKINFYKKPKETKFSVSESGETEFVFRYESNFSIEFSPEGIKPNNVDAGMHLGYVNEKGKFISDSRNGPEIRNSEQLNDKIWWLGNAFNFRIPPVNHAVAFSFYLPEQSEFGSDFSMKLWGYDSELSYPLELSGGCYFRIMVNNTEIHEKYEPNSVLNKAGETEYIRFPLGNVLRSGKNMIVISTSKINKSFFALWKIEIY